MCREREPVAFLSNHYDGYIDDANHYNNQLMESTSSLKSHTAKNEITAETTAETMAVKSN